jgi:two-component system chemotaxis sensor kinase CheA
VALELKGTDIEVDKSVSRRDRRSRHASAEERARSRNRISDRSTRCGKPRIAKLVLSAEREAVAVVILVTDDGCGIDVRKVLERARAANLVFAKSGEPDRHGAARADRPAWLLYVSECVLAFSGRGVGLDVVATKVRSLGGSVVADNRFRQRHNDDDSASRDAGDHPRAAGKGKRARPTRSPSRM